MNGIRTYHVGGSAILVHNSCFTSMDALSNLRALEGLKPNHIDDLARNSGCEVVAGKPGKMNPATRYYQPGTKKAKGFRVLPEGVPGQDGIKGGPYMKYFCGPHDGLRVELAAP